MSTTHSRTRTRIRAIVVAILVLAFVIPWTYAHIAYAWPWKRFQTGTRITCQDRYLVTCKWQSSPTIATTGKPVEWLTRACQGQG